MTPAQFPRYLHRNPSGNSAEAVEIVTWHASTSQSGHRVVRELDRIITERGMPKTIVSDNGTELTSMTILKWVQKTVSIGIISRPESPNRTVSTKALSVSCGRLGDEIACRVTNEILNETLFGTLRDARKTLDEWQEDYNWRRPHSVLANMTPMEFLQRKAVDKMAA